MRGPYHTYQWNFTCLILQKTLFQHVEVKPLGGQCSRIALLGTCNNFWGLISLSALNNPFTVASWIVLELYFGWPKLAVSSAWRNCPIYLLKYYYCFLLSVLYTLPFNNKEVWQFDIEMFFNDLTPKGKLSLCRNVLQIKISLYTLSLMY